MATLTRGTQPAAGTSSARARRGWAPWPLSPRSLRVQMTLGSALVALLAVLVVVSFALATVTVAFNGYERGQLSREASRLASTYGAVLGRYASGDVEAGVPLDNPSSLFANPSTDFSTVWILDGDGNVSLAFSSTAARRAAEQDKATVLAALRQALAGHPSSGSLSGFSFPDLTERLYAAQPIYLGGTSSGVIVGALALSTPARPDSAAIFAGSVSRTMLLVALGAAALAAMGAAAFSRRLIQPLQHLAAATARMARGDYGARVEVPAPDELRSLAESFNGMAAALERDVGELRRQEQMRRELVANVSHELATPLTAIQGFTEALLDGVVDDPAERDETTRLIAREVARLRRLVDQMRQMAVLDGGINALDRTEVQLAPLVSETLAVLAPELERKQVTLADELPDDLPAVFADADRLTEILLNLLDNALRHTPPGGRIEVGGASEGGYVAVAIADTGPGIAPGDHQRIFERFYRVDSSRSAATGGTGLGLAIVRALVEAHGGTIRAEDRPGGGARFTFTLPVAAREAAAVGMGVGVRGDARQRPRGAHGSSSA